MRYPCLVPKRLCKIDITPVSYTHLEKVELSKRMKPEAVDNLESTIRSLHKKYGIMPKAVIHSPLKVEDATATYNWIDAVSYTHLDELQKYGAVKIGSVVSIKNPINNEIYQFSVY